MKNILLDCEIFFNKFYQERERTLFLATEENFYATKLYISFQSNVFILIYYSFFC